MDLLEFTALLGTPNQKTCGTFPNSSHTNPSRKGLVLLPLPVSNSLPLVCEKWDGWKMIVSSWGLAYF